MFAFLSSSWFVLQCPPPTLRCILKDRSLYQHPSEMLFTIFRNCCHPHLRPGTFLIAGGNKCSSNITSPLAHFNKNAKLYTALNAFKIPSESEKTWNWNKIDRHWCPNENQFNYFCWCIASRQVSNSISTSIISLLQTVIFLVGSHQSHIILATRSANVQKCSDMSSALGLTG